VLRHSTGIPVVEPVQVSAAVLAAEEADVGVRDEDALRIVRVELHAVGRRHVETARRPAIVAARLGVRLRPGGAAVVVRYGAEEVRRERDVGRVRSDREVVRRVEPDRVRVLGGARLDPGRGEVREGRSDSACTTLQLRPAVARLRDAVPRRLASARQDDAAQPDVGHQRKVRDAAIGPSDGIEPLARPSSRPARLADGVEQRAVRGLPAAAAVLGHLHARPRPPQPRAVAAGRVGEHHARARIPPEGCPS
jgi:hypothetical protein